ncbi:uncharacterized protein PHALS_14668 [Plasmopara halstedii]|uniref:Uncharacterized protein n=1 Tax=Plasmopara halstedii TaxID=4781 RepID=A0A0P1ANV0_PLAHL|nr:uncharacterized protein PHALS_14668 [Plasmopara halstedii]CEG42930.1 hypothetical protein PHALS_14668 [Plasmopara halstedii]|eukprot:XP_024579299.1 hypothetical protein PHALS_14668 [Plasmopara halstedii]
MTFQMWLTTKTNITWCSTRLYGIVRMICGNINNQKSDNEYSTCRTVLTTNAEKHRIRHAGSNRLNQQTYEFLLRAQKSFSQSDCYILSILTNSASLADARKRVPSDNADLKLKLRIV